MSEARDCDRSIGDDGIRRIRFATWAEARGLGAAIATTLDTT